MDDERATDILRRLKSVEGHIRGIERMVEHEAYCVAVVNQLPEVPGALQPENGLVLDRHLHTCVTQAIRGDDPGAKEQVLAELMDLFEATGRA